MAAALLAALLAAAPEMIPPDAGDLAGRTAPDFELPLRGGGTFRLAGHRGKTVIIAFWASWCGPCRQELPALSRLSVGRPELAIVAINVDRDPGAAEAFLRALPVSLPIALDPDARALGLFGALSMPNSFVIDRHGTVKLHKVGYSAEKGLAEVLAAVDAAR